jgi:hypothetical protein
VSGPRRRAATGLALVTTVVGIGAALWLPDLAFGKIFVVLGVLVPLWIWYYPFCSAGPGARGSVGLVGDQSRRGGYGLRVGRRWVVAPVEVVLVVLGRTGRSHQRPGPRERVPVAEPARGGRPEIRGNEARVWVWGPSVRVGGASDFAVLRTRRALSTRIRRIRFADVAHIADASDVQIILPGTGSVTSAGMPSVSRTLAGSLQDHVVVLADSQPVLAGLPVVRRGSPDHRTIAVTLPVLMPGSPLSASPEAPSVLPGTTPDRVDILPGADARQAYHLAVTRRAALQLGGTAALCAAGGAVWWYVDRTRPVCGAGWINVFLDGGSRTQPWFTAAGVSIDHGFVKLSGLESLELSTARLRELDFITCPNDFVKERLSDKVNRLLGHPPLALPVICRESMVVLVQQAFVKALLEAGLIVWHDDRRHVWFDLATYLGRCTTRWKTWDPTIPKDGGALLTLETSDPNTAGGGQNLLSALDDAREQQPAAMRRSAHHETADSLWHRGTGSPEQDPSGPLGRSMPSSSGELFDEARAGHRHMIYTYEHEALAMVSAQPGFVVFRTIPEVAFAQHLLALTSRGRAVARALTTDGVRKALGNLAIAASGQEEQVARRLDDVQTKQWPALADGLSAKPVSWPPRKLAPNKYDVGELLARYRASLPHG